MDYILHIDNTYPTTWVANLVIQLVDPVLPLVDIPISATITAQLAMFSVAEYDFGSVYTNRGSRNLNLILTSVGREPLQFLGVSTNFMGTGFELLSTPNPLTMQFQQQTQFPIQINTNTGPIGMLCKRWLDGVPSRAMLLLKGCRVNCITVSCELFCELNCQCGVVCRRRCYQKAMAGMGVYPRVQVNGRAVCLSARRVLVCCCIAGPVHCRTWPVLLC